MIIVSFGNNAMKRLKEQSIQEGKKIRLSSFIQQLYKEKLEELEYSDESIARIFFECALDYYSISVAEYILKKMQQRKIPSKIPLEIDDSIGRIE